MASPYGYNGNPPPSVTYATAVPVAPLMQQQQQQTQYSLPPSQAREVDEEMVRRLKDQGFPVGLAKSLTANNLAFPLRIWVVDNSGSMQKTDGHRIVETATKNDVKIVSCTRWDEIRECVNYHVQMSALLHSPTSFRLLNNPGAAVGPQQFGIAETTTEMIPYDAQNAMDIMRKARPGGCTPLTAHVREIHSAVESMSNQLMAEGKRVVIVLATDGLPTDEQGYNDDFQKRQFVDSLRMLEGLPVWVVVRLCTDEEDVVNFYNDLDEQLELSLEVLDDFVGEAEEVYEHNKWLNYALPLHRCREMGYHDRVFDMIDERALTKGELRDFCALLFGLEQFDGVPDPNVDWTGFIKEIDGMLKKEKLQWHPIKKKMMPWIDIKKLHRVYGDGSSCIVM